MFMYKIKLSLIVFLSLHVLALSVNTTEVPVETQPACVNTSSDMLRPCDVTTPFQFATSPPLSSTEASPTGDSTVLSPTTDSVFGSLPIIVGVAGGIIAIVTTVAIMIIICLCVRSRTCVLKTANNGISYDNPALKTCKPTCNLCLHIYLLSLLLHVYKYLDY